MANNLKSFKFTKKADTAISETGWEVLEGVVINALAGNDIIKGTSTRRRRAILNYGTINTGAGKDTIIGTSTGTYSGISNYGTINTDTGNDTIIGTSTGIGIFNNGTIDTGDGKDTITGTGTGYGILNYGTINTGAGKDIVDALEGGFDGDGTTYLDAGNDTLKGFGTGNFYGGAGTDKLFFGEGTYVISGSTVVFNGATMNVNQFEKIGGANGGLFTFQDGTLTVSSTGVGTFA